MKSIEPHLVSIFKLNFLQKTQPITESSFCSLDFFNARHVIATVSRQHFIKNSQLPLLSMASSA